MGSQRLSDVLCQHGFYNVLGTMNYTCSGESIIGEGIPFTTDSNNGVMVVYDEKGVPWEKCRCDITEEDRTALAAFSLRQGAWVPHSNDGGGYAYRTLHPYAIRLGNHIGKE